MTKDELLARLKGFEWNDVEFKLAQRGIPEDAFSTVSAFANTSGGWLVFGIRQQAGGFSIEGVVEVDKVQNDFLSVIRSRQKLNHDISVAESAIEHEGAHVLAFYVPESQRGAKPVYLKGDIRQSFIRRGGGDERCTQAEIERMLRDASARRYDAEPLDLDPERCFDGKSIRWYRSVFNRANPGKDETADDLKFLHDWGFVVEQHGKLLPTRAAVLLFGGDAYFRQVLPRMVVDFQFYGSKVSDYSPEVKWDDRLQAEENLVKTWQAITNFFFRYSERPFGVDPVTLRRSDDPPSYVSFREAAINLLIHQDFGDHTRTPVIRLFSDQSEFFNPGDAFASREILLDPGNKEVRNPTIVNAFRRIGLSDQGGTGVGAIFAGWRKLGFIPPIIENDKTEKTFRLRLQKIRLLTEEQILAQARLGVTLSDSEAVVFAYLIRQGKIDIADVKGLTGLSGPDAIKLVERLTIQKLLMPMQLGGHLYKLADHLQAHFHPAEPTVVEESDTGPNRQVSDSGLRGETPLMAPTPEQWMVINGAESPRSLHELWKLTSHKLRKTFGAEFLESLLSAGLLRMTGEVAIQPHKQLYVLSDLGLKLKALRKQSETEQQDQKITK